MLLRSSLSSLPRPAACTARSAAVARAPLALPRRQHSTGAPLPGAACRASIRGVATLDGSVVLDSVSRDLLTWSLEAPGLCAEVAAGIGLSQDRSVRFTGHLFQPVPWSPTTKHGMPQELEVRASKAQTLAP